MNPDTTQPAVAPGSLEEALLEIRRGIDAVDDEIVALLNKRAALSLEVGRRKDGRFGDRRSVPELHRGQCRENSRRSLSWHA